MRTIVLVLTIALLPVAFVAAQSSTEAPEKTRHSSYASIGLRYKSDYYYMGRSDSIKAPYLIPSIGYYHKSGLFIRSSLAYLTTDEEQRIDLVTLSGGYDYFGKKVNAGISVDQYFFSDESYSVQAEMRTYVSGYVGYDFTAFMIIADASLGVSENVDVFLGGELTRTFYALRDRIQITPSFYTNLGTQRYYDQYYTKRTLTTGGTGSGGGGKGKGGGSNGASSSITEISILESEKFQVLDYELGLQLGYKINKLRFLLSGTFLFPVNPSTVVTETGTYEEDLENGFVWSAGLRYRIGQ